MLLKGSHCDGILVSVIMAGKIWQLSDQSVIWQLTACPRTWVVQKNVTYMAAPRLWWHLEICGVTAMTSSLVSILSPYNISLYCYLIQKPHACISNPNVCACDVLRHSILELVYQFSADITNRTLIRHPLTAKAHTKNLKKWHKASQSGILSPWLHWTASPCLK